MILFGAQMRKRTEFLEKYYVAMDRIHECREQEIVDDFGLCLSIIDLNDAQYDSIFNDIMSLRSTEAHSSSALSTTGSIN